MDALTSNDTLTRLIGVVGRMIEFAPTRRERKRLLRLLSDLCLLASAIRELDRVDREKGTFGSDFDAFTQVAH